MLTTMRKRIRVIMIIVAVAFVAGFLMGELWSMLSSRREKQTPLSRGIVAEVGETKVSTDQYRNATAYITNKYKEENRLRDLSNEDYARVEQQTWQFLVLEITWGELLKDAKVSITENEVVQIMQSNPPEEIRNNPELQDSAGNFDQQKYLQVMNNPQNQRYFQKYFQDLVEMLPKEKLRIHVANSYRVTPLEVDQAMRADNAKWKVTSLYFGPGVIEQKVEPTDEELWSYYEQHIEELEKDEVRNFQYVFLPLELTAADSVEAKDIIDRAYRQLKEGETFNMTLLDFSELLPDTISYPVPRTRLEDDADSIVSRLSPGRYSEPFLGKYGWQIVMLDSITTDTAGAELVSMRRILVRVKMSGENVAAARDSVRDFADRTEFNPFDSVAAQMGMRVVKGRPMVGGKLSPGGIELYSPTQLEDWLKRAKPGSVKGPMAGPGGYYVFQLTDVVPGGPQDFESAKSSVAWKVRQAWERAAWNQMAEAASAQVRAGKTFEQFAAENPKVETQTDEFTGVTDCRRRKGAAFAGALLALEQGQVSSPVEAAWGVFLIRCDERAEAGEFNPDDYIQRRQREVAQTLLSDLLEQPEIKDYREPFGY